MPRIASFDDNKVGKSSGDYFKLTGTKERPQVIALIPGEVFEEELKISDSLKAKASQNDRDAIEKIEEIQALKDNITRGLGANPKRSEVWTNPEGKKCILFPRLEYANVFWVENYGYVLDKDGIPEQCKEKGVTQNYGMILIEYEANEDGIRILPEDQQIDLGNGAKLDFRYSLKVTQFNESRIRAWKEHQKNFPLVSHDYDIFEEKQGNSKRTKFAPKSGVAKWRSSPEVMNRIMLEARKLVPSVRKNLGKDLNVDEVLKMFPNLSSTSVSRESSSSISDEKTQEVDFEKLLG
jgi:hypothetical protein